MPAGVSWSNYIGATVCALISMFAGAQTVHILYKPLKNFDSRVEIEKQKLTEASTLANKSSQN